MSSSLTAKSHAKINLFLHIKGVIKEGSWTGYHNIESVFIPLNLHDKVFVEPAENLECKMISRNSLKLYDVIDNIAIKAGRKLQEYCNFKLGAKIFIEKAIPVAAGLGGGSSNAATVLLLLNRLWNLDLNLNELNFIASSIGADVPFFLQNKSAFIEGIGDKVTPIHFKGCAHILIANPGIAVSSKDVYKEYSAIEPGNFTNQNFEPDFLERLGTGNILLNTKNDLQTTAIGIAPAIMDLITLLNGMEGCIASRMSGSGATCFAIFKSKKYMTLASNKLRHFRANWWCHCETIDFSALGK